MYTVEHDWSQLGSKINSFQKDDGKFSDIDLVVENQVFKGHKVVLASASPYFETMFSTLLCEKDKKKIEIYGLKKELFQILFDYIYKRKLEINEDNIQEILEGANMLQLTSLTTACCTFLKKKLNEKTVISIYILVDIYSSTESLLDLKRECKFFIEKNFLYIIKNQQFLDLPYHLFENLLKSESLIINNELDVLRATLKWILKEPKQRFNHIYTLMKYVRLPLVPEYKKEQFIDKIQHDELKFILRNIVRHDLEKNELTIMKQNNELEDPVEDEGLKNLMKINNRWKPRYMNSCIFYLIGGRTFKNNQHLVSSDIRRIDSYNFKFSKLKGLLVPRFNHQSVEMNGLIYIAGGMNASQSHLKLVEIFDYYDNEKVHPSYMINSRSDFGLTTYNGFLLAIGGSTKYPNLIERYDPKTNLWSNFDSINELPIKGFRVVKIKDLIFIIGGVNKLNQLLDQLLSYNPETGQVKKLSSMKEARASFGCAYAFGHIYVIGGSLSNNNRTTAERYSLADNEWIQISDLDRPVENCVVAVNFNKLLIIGGEDPITRSISNKMNCYDPEKNNWTYFKDLPFAISGSSLVC